MKLIKLSSDSSGEFENIFNTDILIEPFSKIGLVSASVPLSDKSVTIDETNNSFQMRTQKTDRDYYTCNLKTGYYSQTSFLQEMTRCLNSALNNDIETTATVQWRSDIITSKLQLEMKRGAINENVVEANLSKQVELTYNAGAKTYTKDTPGEDAGAFGVTANFFTGGCGEASLDTPLATSKIAIGLLEEQPNPNATVLETSDYNYVCFTATGSPNYQISSADGVVVSTVAQEDADRIVMELSEGKLNFIVFKGGTPTILHSFDDWAYSHSYYLAFNVRSGAIKDVVWSPDPFVELQDQVYIYPKASHNDNVIYDLTQAGVGGKASISFALKPTTGDYLGFHETVYEMPQTGKNWTLLADEALSEAVSFTDLLVEIPSLSMESFDGSLGRKRPIIGYIPSLEIKHNELVFFSHNPIMIDLSNVAAFNLNRVQVRLLSSSSQEVQIESASIVILIGK